jgi:hypothetical protein
VGLKKLSPNTGGGGRVEGTLEDDFIVFCRQAPDFCTPKFHILKRIVPQFREKTECLKQQLASLIDHFDRCFPHTTGEGLQLWF